MAINLSSNPTCVLSDADNLTAEQRQKINLNLTKGIPGSNISGDKVTVINSEGEVEMKAYSAGGGGGSSYSAGNGIDITSDTISAKVDNSTIGINASGQLEAIGGGSSYYAGNGINISEGIISAKVDNATIGFDGRGSLCVTGGTDAFGEILYPNLNDPYAAEEFVGLIEHDILNARIPVVRYSYSGTPNYEKTVRLVLSNYYHLDSEDGANDDVYYFTGTIFEPTSGGSGTLKHCVVEARKTYNRVESKFRYSVLRYITTQTGVPYSDTVSDF